MFVKATKARSKLRAALFGPSGSGKTFTALQIATGLGGSIAFIDTERRTASKYADRFGFDVCDLTDRTIQGYVTAINAASAYDVLIIDSLSHAWQELLQQVDALAKAKYRGNTWSAWSEGTPLQRKLVDSILDCPGHVIATMRSKTEWTSEPDPRTGKTTPRRVGLAPEQGKGVEYEFDFLLELSVEHICTVIKDRSGRFQDRIIEKPGPELGKELAAWLDEGVSFPPDLRAVAFQALNDVGLLAMIRSVTEGKGATLEDVPMREWDRLRKGLANSKCLEAWNNGRHPNSGATLVEPAELAEPEPEPAAAA